MSKYIILAFHLVLQGAILVKMSEDRESLFKLGQQYFSGDGIPRDLEAALDCFKRSAELGFAPAQFQLGLAHDPTGLARTYGISGDSTVAFQWYLKAAEQGNLGSMKMVAMGFQMGIHGAPQDRGKAVEWYAKLVQFDDTYAMMQLGLIAIDGKQIETGAEWLEAAAELGDPLALSLYRSYVKVGVLPALDPQKELALLESAAEKGDVEAMLALGLKCEKGEGVPVDLPKAYALLTLVSICEDAKARPDKASEGIARIKKKMGVNELKIADELFEAMHRKLSQLLD